MISRTFLFLLVCTLASLKVLAIDERYAALPLSGNKIRKDSFSIVRDSVFFDNTLRPDQTTYKVRNLITFKINEFANFKLPAAFDVTVSFKVYFIRVYNGPLDSIETSLNVKYNTGSYPQKAIYTFTGGYEAKVKITNVAVNQGTLSEFENSLMLENEILIQREYVFSCTNNAVTAFNTQSYLSDKGELYVAWSPQRAADEYDLEWTYIDSSAGPNYYIPNTINYNATKVFANNATRVSITQSSYRIPLLYDSKGFLFYRVRAVQVKPNGQRIESFWSSVYGNGLGKYDFTGHERSLNWQASTSFAEEGKRKSVVQYFDGSLRNRQTVTKDNTTDTTIVAETLYDYQGRPAIQVLPTPSLSSMIKYTPNFNAPVNGVEYDKDLYDGLLADSCYCKQGAPAMGTLSGAAKYYSPNNPLVNTSYHKYIPDAKGFPFSETRYTPDNTDRVSLQSGVGADFQIDSGRAARYFYSAADQEELDVLFGTEVGNASHYFKNMVRDANGQYSISYVDMHGRTIATALAGRPLTKMDTLASAKSFTITKKLLDSNTNVIKGTSIESGKALIVTKAGNHRFQYSLLTDSISIQACQGTICYDCSYDLEITITDDCNNSTLPGGVPYVITRNNLTIDTTCNPNIAFPGVDQTVFLREGNYLVSKKLTISKKAMDDYREVFLRRNTCKTLEQFIADQMLLLDIDCEPTCASCRTAIGTWETFRPNYMQQMSIPVGDTAAHREAALLAYNNMVKECDNLCYGKSMDKSIREQMLADVTAPDGQYADPNAVDGASVLRDIGNNTLLYSTITNYTDENGNPDASPSQLPTVDQFVSAFKPSWAEALLLHHPEYPKLKRYEDFKDSHVWDEKFGRTESFKAAVDSGYLNPANFSNLPSNPIYTHYPQRADPFFTSLATNKKAAMQDSLLNKVKLPNNATTSAWAIATIMAHCPGGDDNCRIAYSSNDLAFSMDTACSGELDIAWRYFRELYLQEKREIISDILTDYATTFGKTPGYYNDLVTSGHTLNFVGADAGELIAIPHDPQQAQAQSKDSITKFINDNCKAYATQWWEQLKPCNFSSNDSATIIDRLIQVCREGGDSSHVFGSSTVRPSSTNLDRSFEQVVKAYAGSNYNTTCNVFLLTAPLPYDKQPIYYNKPVFQKPDSCECATIGNLYSKYQLAGIDASFSGYIYRTTGTSINQGVLDTLRKACNGEINCSFLKQPIIMPPVLQCGGGEDVCVSCTGVSTLYTAFKQQFPGVAPSYDDTDSTQRTYNALFEKFMNVNLGFGKKTAEYLDFITACGVSDDYCNVALAFNGTTGKKRVTIPVRNNRLNLGTGDFTFEVRIKPKSNSPFNQILSNRTYSSGPLGNGFSFLIQNTGQLLIQMEGCYNYQSINSGGVDVFDGKPHHVAVSRQGDSLGLYIDGIKLSYAVLCDIGTTEPPSQRDITTSGPWYIGMDTTGAAPYPLTGFNGWIDEVRVWNVARSEADIANNLNTTLSAQPNLVGYYLLRSKDTCEQSIVDLSTPDTSLRNNGYLGYSPAKDMTDPSWLSAAQVSYTAADPVGVPNACGCNGTGFSNCDTLQMLLADYKRYGGIPHLDASGADTTNWKVDFGGLYYTARVPLGEVIKNGVMKLPDYYTDTLPDVGAMRHVDFDRIKDTLCLDSSGFTFETRLRLPDSLVLSNSYNDSWWLVLYSDTATSGNLLVSLKLTPDKGGAICTHQSDSKVSCIEENVPHLPMDVWRKVRLQFRGRQFSYYIDSMLVGTRTLDAPMTKIYWWTLVQYSQKGEIDYIRIYDTAGRYLYKEEFNDARNLAIPDPSAECSGCEVSFTKYFNQRKGTSYTYSQIASLYAATCGIALNPCQDTMASTLWSLKDEFVNNYYNHGRTYDNNGCDIKTWQINNSGTFGNTAATIRQETFQNGAMQFPDTLNVPPMGNGVDFDFVKRDSACIERHFSFEVKLKHPLYPGEQIHSLVFEIWFSYNPAKKFYITFNERGLSGNNISYYDYSNAANSRSHLNVAEFQQDFSNWRILKFEVIDTVLNYYVDGQLLKTLYFPPGITLDKWYGFGMASRSDKQLSAAYDWVKAYDKNNNLFYFEDFNSCSDHSYFAPYIRCPQQPCTEAFSTYYNQQKGTNYTFSQIDSIYYHHSGKHLDVCSIPAENPSCTFQKTYGGSGTDIISDVKQTSDKSYVMAGRTNSFGNGNLDAYVVKTDKEGNLLWSRTYGGTNEDYFSRIRPTTDGGYIAVGTTRSYNQSQGEIFVVKMNQAGDVTWSRAFGRGTAGGDIGTNIIQTSDGGYVIAGNTNHVPTHSDGILVRLNSAGNIVWTRRLGSNNSDDHCEILQDNDTLIAVMEHFSNAITGIPSTNYNGLVTKLNMSNGHVFWAKSYDVNSPNSIRIMDVYQTNGGYKIAALGTVGWGSDNVRTLSFDINRNGDITQVRRLQAPRDTVVGYAAIYPTSDGGFIASQGEFNSSADVYWHKTNAAGTIEWSNVVKRAGDQRLAKVLQNYDGSYAGAGYHNGDALLMKVTAAGKAGCGDSSVNYSNDTVPWFVYPVPLPLDNYDSVIFSNPNITVTAQNAGTIVTSLCDNCGLPGGLTLCGRTEPVFPPVTLNQHSPCDDSTLFAVSKGTLLYEAYRDSLMNSFDDRYLAKCLNARYNESFTVEQPISEYHYTLYYYDQAGNLVKTIPPQGVDVSKFAWAASYSDSVKTARRNRQVLKPAHALPTQYRYNALNQVVAQQSPDGGITNFWYDRLGRVAVSQNAKQKAAGSSNDQDRLYSYTSYDNLGRITEVGQVKNTSANGAMADGVSRSVSSLGNWLQTLNSRREQITQTIYDLPYNGFIGAPDPRTVVAQRNIRNRVSYVSYTEHNNPAAYNQATFYTYDILGNVDTLLQDYGCGDCGVVASYNMMNRTGNARKKFTYQYDLISGKVNMMLYQNGWSDMWLHRYTYDAENRLVLTETSNDSLVWEKDARYEYYRHGSLARTVIGEQLVQGLDYAYTLQGWLKGVNSTGATSTHDIGADGKAGSLNQYVARDALGFNLNYFQGDYKAINAGVTSFPSYRTASGLPDSVYRPLYNGNISSMATHLRLFDAQGHVPIFYNYKYDQLNRLTRQDAFFNFNASTNSYSSNWMPDSTFHEDVSYDANGNIQHYNRYAIGPQSKMDGLSYRYYPGTNKLRQVNDHIVANKYGSNSWELIQDLDDQSDTSNYIYDEIGNLIADKAEKITNIKWNVYGKIAEITRSAIASDKVNTTRIQYTYDAQGNRISKVTEKAGTTVKEFTWYVRDAQGNIISTYKASGSVNETTLQNLTNISLEDQMIYGSSRLGMYAYGNGVFGGPNSRQFYSGGFFERGRRQYELTNHLGNVLTTISDKKTGVSSGGIGAAIDYYEPDMVSASDYYPFGMVSRVASSSTGKNYRFGFNGKENDNDVKGWGNQQDYGMRIYDPRIGKFLSVDPITKEYPELTPYQFASNRPIDGIDQDGLEHTPATIGDRTARRDQTAVNMRPDPKFETPPHKYNPYRNFNVPGNFHTFSTYVPPTNDLVKDRIAANNERNWLDAGFQRDGSMTPAQKLMRNKYWINFHDNLAMPLLNGYSLASGLGEIRAGLKAVSLLKAGAAKSSGGFGTTGVLEGIELTVNNVTANRVLLGSSENIAVVGRNMTRVNDFAKGIGAETWTGFNATLSEAENLANNAKWVQGLKDKGYTIFDVGLDPKYTMQGNYDKGVFYGMEVKKIFGEK